MTTDIVVPRVGEAGTEYDIVRLVEWKVTEGDRVERGDTVLYLETEKASCDIDAEASGFLHILVREGDKAMIGAVVGIIAETREELERLQKEQPLKPAQEP